MRDTDLDLILSSASNSEDDSEWYPNCVQNILYTTDPDNIFNAQIINQINITNTQKQKPV